MSLPKQQESIFTMLEKFEITSEVAMYFLHFSPFTKSDLSFLTIRGIISKFESYTVRNRKGEGEGKGRPVLLFSRSPPPPSPIRTATQA